MEMTRRSFLKALLAVPGAIAVASFPTVAHAVLRNPVVLEKTNAANLVPSAGHGDILFESESHTFYVESLMVQKRSELPDPYGGLLPNSYVEHYKSVPGKQLIDVAIKGFDSTFYASLLKLPNMYMGEINIFYVEENNIQIGKPKSKIQIGKISRCHITEIMPVRFSSTNTPPTIELTLTFDSVEYMQNI